jgi:hypothetical protein
MTIEGPDESQIIDDKDKALEMAKASDMYRTLASKARLNSNEKAVNDYEANAELAEDKAEIKYDIQKAAAAYDDQTLKYMVDASERIYEKAKKYLSDLKTEAETNPSPTIVEEIDKAVKETNRLNRENDAWKEAWGERIGKNSK